MTTWKNLLHSLGFSDSEASVYLSCLELGPSPVQIIAKKAGVSRVTTYAVIETLTENGLMSSVEKGKKKLFAAESPEKLYAFVEGKLKHTEATLKELGSHIDELKLVQKDGKPVVKLFEGKEALHAIQDDVIATQPTEAIEFGNLDAIRNLYEESSPYRQSFLERMQKIGVKRKSIYYTQGDAPQPNDERYARQTLPESTKAFFGDVYVYGNKVALSTLRGKQISVIIESSDLADTLRALIERAWDCNDSTKK